jgi:hypothetical protein
MWMRVLLIITGATIALGVFMTHAGLVLALPRAYAMLQFSFRLESFVLLGISGAVLAVLVMTRDGGPRLQRWTWLLAPVAAVSVIGAVEQTRAHPQGLSRSTTALASYLNPLPEHPGQIDYVYAPLALYAERMPLVQFPIATVASRGRASAVARVPPNRLVASNIRAGPNLVSVTGAKIVGIDKQFDDVLELTPTDGPQSTATVSVAPADPLPVAAGRTISLIALIVIAGELGVIAVRSVRLSWASRIRAPARSQYVPPSLR